ncbi:unnamed protein product [Ambrosiozyma monospora]|uniref:Unnamed protein product n=1 Tax=Ambrosiozyma monospora TaxID=43982 RepID=A0ACB5T4X2_AMBMO|nr:unnamed protein product [Ambrosiozyma monospora]
MAQIRISSITISYTAVLFLLLAISLSALTSFVRVQTYYTSVSVQPNVSFNDIIIPTLQLVPSQFFYYPWTLLTETFVETSILKFFVALIVLFAGVNYLDSNWNVSNNSNSNSADAKVVNVTAKYIILVSLLTNVTSVLIKVFLALAFNAVDLRLPLSHGIYSILMSFVVVFKQLSPEHNLKLFKIWSIRVRQIPFIILCIATLASILLQSLEPVIPIYNNFYISWAYLRYYQLNVTAELLPSSASGIQQTSLVRGDASDTFAFIQFFPEEIHRFLKPVCRAVYHTSALLGLIRPFNDDDIESSNLRTIKRLNTTATSVTRDIADRRRQVALKVLEQRVGGSAAVAGSSAGSAGSSANATNGSEEAI